MDDALAIHRLHFAFTVTFHYLFPQLTMGLALVPLVLPGLNAALVATYGWRSAMLLPALLLLLSLPRPASLSPFHTVSAIG